MIPTTTSTGGGDDPAGIPPLDVPMTEATIDGDSHLGLSVEQHSTKSSQGRKLRQVLQKKQLDVLLQTYSSYIEEPSASADGGQQADPKTDRFTISRKQSIEGNVVQLPHNRQTTTSRSSSDIQVAYSGDDEVQVLSTSMRKNASQDGGGGGYPPNPADGVIPNHHKHQALLSPRAGTDSDTEQESDEAVAKNFKNNLPNIKEGGRKGRKKHYVTTSRRAKNNNHGSGGGGISSNRRGGGGEDFSTRMQKANEVVKTFTSRCGQKHMEIAADFQEATKELRHHLKSGADVAFEDLADQFDGIVNDLFVGENEQRDDDGGRGQQQQQQHQQPRSGSTSRNKQHQQYGVHVNWPQRHSNIGSSQREGAPSPSSTTSSSAFRPLSHDEALLKMNRQVKENIWRPAKNFADRVYEMNCGPTGNGVAFEIEPGRVVRLPSF